MEEVKLHVQLLSYTADAEKLVSSAAKLCYSSKDTIDLLKDDVSEEFLQKLQDLEHFSPFEHASFTFLIKGVSRSLLAQLTRHRIASFSVRSQRYVNEGDFSFIIPPSIAKLGSYYVKLYEGQMEQLDSWYQEWNSVLGNSGESSNEDARFILPNATATTLIMTMNARELFHFFELRCCNRAQWEIRQLADTILKMVKEVYPLLFSKAGAKCCTGKDCREKDIMGCKK